MSRIQKALAILRESQSNLAVENAQRRSDVRYKSHERVPPNSPEAGRARMHFREDEDASAARAAERLPADLIHVEPESLIAAGLNPNPSQAYVIAQQFRRIKRPVINLAFGEGQPESENANMVMIASALPKSGKTWCAINLAESIARERDIGAVIVDADVLKPNISRSLGLSERVGLIDHLLDSSISIDDIIVPTDFHDIVLVPAGRQHEEATELLASRRMERFVAALSHRFRSRLVIVDTPPLLLTNEAQVLAEHMGQIVMVIEAGVSTQESVTQALESLNRDKPINAILNKTRGGTFSDYAGAYGGGYYYSSVPRAETEIDEQ